MMQRGSGMDTLFQIAICFHAPVRDIYKTAVVRAAAHRDTFPDSTGRWPQDTPRNNLLSAPRYDALVAVGDNLSLDTNASGPHMGAASLLYRNRESAWPEFKGRDMGTRDPAVRLLTLAQDGATALATLNLQMKRVPAVEEPVLATITVGSQDLLHLAGSPHVKEKGVENADGLYDTLTAIFESLLRRLADGHVLVANIPAAPEGADEILAEFNGVIADVAREQGAGLVDLHAHFQGHGPDAGDEAWLTPEFDPTALGASEIRRVFWQALLAI